MGVGIFIFSFYGTTALFSGNRKELFSIPARGLLILLFLLLRCPVSARLRCWEAARALQALAKRAGHRASLYDYT